MAACSRRCGPLPDNAGAAPKLNPDLHIIFQAMAALVLGGAIGWEREAAGKWAGLRTHMLVCLATTLFVAVGQLLMKDTAAAVNREMIRTDPTRIIEAIATGIAFLGAGTVFRDRQSGASRGLTTAASLLVIAPIGIAIAIDRYLLALGVTVLVLFILKVVHRLEPTVGDHHHTP
jgi:putative Mg2+ transporter-C (MgtC) family protein